MMFYGKLTMKLDFLVFVGVFATSDAHVIVGDNLSSDAACIRFYYREMNCYYRRTYSSLFATSDDRHRMPLASL